MEDEPLAGRPSTSKTDNVERVRSLVREDRRLTLRMISSELNLNRFTVHQILTQDLDMRKVWAQTVPKNLTTEQKANRRYVCLDLLDCLEGEPEFFSRVMTGDESWIFRVRPRDETPKSGVAHCKLSPSQESENEQIQNQIDALFFFFFFFESHGIVHKEFVPPGQTVKLFIGKSLKDSGKGCHVCDQALHSHGCCTTTTPRVTRQSPPMNFWQKKKAFLWFLSPPIRRISVPVTYFHSPAQKPLERAPF